MKNENAEQVLTDTTCCTFEPVENNILITESTIIGRKDKLRDS